MALFNSQKPNQPQIVRTVSYPRSNHGVRLRQPQTRSGVYQLPKFLALASVLIVAGFVIGWPSPSKGASDSVRPMQEAVVQPQPKPIPKLNFTTMGQEIDAVIANYKYLDIGVAVIDIKTGDSMSYGVPNPFVAASTAKLLTAISYLHDVEQGKYTLAQKVGARTAQDALKAMIIDSDNAAWHDFNNGVMSHAELAAYATSIGLVNYNPDKNTITPETVAKLLNDLYQGKLLNKEHTALLLSYMLEAKEVEFITNTVPTGTKVYHKPGYLNDRVHDAAIVDNDNRPYVLVIFTKSRTNSYDRAVGAEIFKQITLSTTQTFSE